MAINTLALLRQAAKEEADKENDPSVTDPEWNRRVNEGYRTLWSLVRAADPEHFVARGTATVVSAVNNFLSVTLGSNRMRQLWFVTGTTADDYERVPRWNLEERALERAHKVVGGTVYIYPASTAVGSYITWIETAFAELAADGSTVDSRIQEWVEYIYLYAAFGGRDKEESDTSGLVARMQRLESEIVSLASDLDSGDPPRVVDVSNRSRVGRPFLPPAL